MTQAEPVISHKHRTSRFHGKDTYSFVNYFCYVLYPPLFLAGPIMTFNDFMWQVFASLDFSCILFIHNSRLLAPIADIRSSTRGCPALHVSLPLLSPDNGSNPALHVCHCNKGRTGVDGGQSFRTEYDRSMEFDYCVAQGEKNFN